MWYLKYRKTILYGTRGNTQLEHSIQHRVQTSPLLPQTIWFSILLKKTPQNLSLLSKVKQCYQEFPGFLSVRKNEINRHSFVIKTTNADPDDNITELDDTKIEEELLSGQQTLVDSGFEKTRHNFFN